MDDLLGSLDDTYCRARICSCVCLFALAVPVCFQATGQRFFVVQDTPLCAVSDRRSRPGMRHVLAVFGAHRDIWANIVGNIIDQKSMANCLFLFK